MACGDARRTCKRHLVPLFVAAVISVVVAGLAATGHLQGGANVGSLRVCFGAVGAGCRSSMGALLGLGTGSLAVAASAALPSGIPAYLEGTAAVTLATGDEAGRLAVALVQSLRAVKTQIPAIVVMLSRGGLGSADCNNATWRAAHHREHISCGGLDTIAPEIISQRYIDALHALGAQTLVIDPIPQTPYTDIPGGPQIFWGMAFNKLHIFNMTQYRKILWMDGDTMPLKNLDHLLKAPMFTAALTYDCCNPNGPAKPSGGLWVVEPSAAVALQLWNLINAPVPGTNDVWHWGDMQVVRYLFGQPPLPTMEEPYWPSINDGRHGYVEGLEFLPEIASMQPAQFAEYLRSRVPPAKQGHVGFMNSTWDGVNPPHVWRSLDVRYDQCVGMCECLPGRDIPKTFMSVHFSCIHNIGKPSKYETEHEFMHALYNYALSCTRFYYLLWYERFTAAAGRLPAPLWDGPRVPLYDATHDEFVRAQRKAAGM